MEGLWYADAVNWMAEAEITSGTEAGQFDPDAQVTRGQAITFLWRMAGRPAPRREAPYPFDDVDVNGYYHDAAHWAAQVGITNGVGERTFGGERVIERALAVTFLHRYNMLNKPQDVEDGEDTGDAPETEDGEDTGDAPETEDGEDTGDAPETEDGEDTGEKLRMGKTPGTRPKPRIQMRAFHKRANRRYPHDRIADRCPASDHRLDAHCFRLASYSCRYSPSARPCRYFAGRQRRDLNGWPCPAE